MKTGLISSDQSDGWSVRFPRFPYAFAATKANGAPSPTSTVGFRSPRLADRTLQALRQSGLQMRAGAWPWTQILPLCQHAEIQAANELCSSRISRTGVSVLDQLPESSSNPRRGLRDQSRTSAPQRAVADNEQLYAAHTDRHNGSRGSSRQHAFRTDKKCAGRGGGK